MAGNYRSTDSGLANKISRVARAGRDTHVRAGVMKKQQEAAKSVISHREGERRKTQASRGKYVVARETVRAQGAVAREKVKLDQIKARGKEARKTAKSRKPSNDMEVGKKSKEPVKKKRRVAKENKW